MDYSRILLISTGNFVVHLLQIPLDSRDYRTFSAQSLSSTDPKANKSAMAKKRKSLAASFNIRNLFLSAPEQVSYFLA